MKSSKLTGVHSIGLMVTDPSGKEYEVRFNIEVSCYVDEVLHKGKPSNDLTDEAGLNGMVVAVLKDHLLGSMLEVPFGDIGDVNIDCPDCKTDNKH